MVALVCIDGNSYCLFWREVRVLFSASQPILTVLTLVASQNAGVGTETFAHALSRAAGLGSTRIHRYHKLESTPGFYAEESDPLQFVQQSLGIPFASIQPGSQRLNYFILDSPGHLGPACNVHSALPFQHVPRY